jgi:hypothetical protein
MRRSLTDIDTAASIKQTLISSTKTENEDFVLGPSTTDSSKLQSVLQDSETKISICWTGGGQIKGGKEKTTNICVNPS